MGQTQTQRRDLAAHWGMHGPKDQDEVRKDLGSCELTFFLNHEDEKDSAQDKRVNQPANPAQAKRASRNTSSTEGSSPPARTGHRSHSKIVNARAALQAKIALHRLK